MLGELLLQIGQRESLRRKLADLEELLGPSALPRVLDELEKIIGTMSAGHKGGTIPEPSRKSPDTDAERIQIPDPALKDPFADLLANLNLPAAEPAQTEHSVPMPPPADKKGPEEKIPPPRELKSEPGEAPREQKKVSTGETHSGERTVLAPPSPPAVQAPPPPSAPPAAAKAPAPPVVKSSNVVLPPGILRKPEPPKEKPPEVHAPHAQGKKKVDVSAYLPKQIPLRSAYPLEPEDILYIHAVAQIPVDEKAAPEPFILEEKGFESSEFVFALDRGGLRFYLSRLTGKTTNVSKTGMLLLNRKESIHLRGTHFSILNDLRAYGLLLPFEFGSVALGSEDLHAKIDEHVYEVRDALEEIVATKWWEVCVYGLDQKMMQFVAPDGPTSQRGDRDRRGGERSTSTRNRIDIKTLERVLNKQKSLAEEIHHQLESLSTRSDVDLMVNLSSGSSDDWKPILRASYEVGSPEIYRFNRSIYDLQYTHLKYQLMFVLTGDREDFSFQQG